MTKVAGYGCWASPITPELVTAAQVGLAQPTLDRGSPTGSRPGRRKVGGRCWCKGRPAGSAPTSRPAPFNVRTRVHEYGGGAYAVREGVIVAANFADQRLWRLEAGGGATPLTPESGGRLRYADLELDPAGNRLFAVREDHRGGGEAVNSIVVIDLDRGDDGRLEVASGHDFFSSPRLSPDRRQLAWLSWDHPDMPWDATALWLAEIAEDGRIGAARRVAGGAGESIVQPAWSPAGELYFVSDRTDWWNIYRVGVDGPVPVCPMSAEFAGPAWTSGWPLVRLPQRRCHPRLLHPGRALASGDDRGRIRPAVAARSALHRDGPASASPTAAPCCARAPPTGRRRSCCSIRRAAR